MHFTLDFQEKDVDDEDSKRRKWHFLEKSELFLVVFEKLTLLSATFMDRTEDKVLPRNIWSAFRKTGMDYAPISWSKGRVVSEIHYRSWIFLFFCFFTLWLCLLYMNLAWICLDKNGGIYQNFSTSYQDVFHDFASGFSFQCFARWICRRMF